MTCDDAINVALCYGWIDGQRKGLNEEYFIQRFTPRRARSTWSKINVAKVAQLIESGRMQAAGLAEVEAAKKDGRWDAAYASQKDMPIPEDLLRVLEQNPEAKAFFETLNKTVVYTFCLRLHKAKRRETRERQISVFVEKLSRGEVPR